MRLGFCCALLGFVAALHAGCTTLSDRVHDGTTVQTEDNGVAINCAEDLAHSQDTLLIVACVLENRTASPVSLRIRQLRLIPRDDRVAVATPGDLRELAEQLLQQPDAEASTVGAMVSQLVEEPQVATAAVASVAPRFTANHLLFDRADLPASGFLRRYLVMRTRDPADVPRSLELCVSVEDAAGGASPADKCLLGALDVDPSRYDPQF